LIALVLIFSLSRLGVSSRNRIEEVGNTLDEAAQSPGGCG